MKACDKSLARPERKQVTANKLRIHSTYCPRRSTHFLGRWSNFFKILKKIQKLVRPTRSPRQQWHRLWKKNGDISVVSSVQRTGDSPTGPDPENRVYDQGIANTGRPLSSGLQVLGEPGHCRARTRQHWWTSGDVFSSKWPSITPTEMSNTRRW